MLDVPPEPAYAARHADWFAAGARRFGGGTLDYSLASMAGVDRVLGRLERRGSDAMAEVVLGAGFYAGEVLVRGYGYTWSAVPDDIAPMFGFPYAVGRAEGALVNVLGKAFARVENGPEDSVETLVRLEAASSDATPPA